MYFDDFSARLHKNPIPKVILFFGDSESVMTEGTGALKEVFKKNQPAGTLLHFDGTEHSLAHVLSEAQTTSFFSTEQLIFVRHAEKLLGGHSEAALRQLAEYFENPNPESHLIFLATGIRKTAKIVAAVEKQGWTVQCAEMPEWKMGGWVREKAQKVQLEISEEGAQTLVQKVGTDMVYLQKALEQLSIYLYPQKSASVEDIKSLSVPGGEAEIFSFLDAVGSRQTEKAIRLLESMAAESGLAMMLYQRVRELLMVRLGQNKGIEQVAMAQNLGLHPFRLKNLWEQAKQYSVTELKTALQDLIRIQTGQVMGRLGKATVAVVLEWWLVKWGVNRLSAIARRP